MKKFKKTLKVLAERQPIEELSDVRFYSMDKDSAYFEFDFIDVDKNPIELTEDTNVKVVYTFSTDERSYLAEATIEDNKALVKFNTSLITKYDYVYMYVYLNKGETSIDVFNMRFRVLVSELHKVTGTIESSEEGRITEDEKNNYLSDLMKHFAIVKDGTEIYLDGSPVVEETDTMESEIIRDEHGAIVDDIVEVNTTEE